MRTSVLFCAVVVWGCGPPGPARTGSLVSPDVFVEVVHPHARGGSRGRDDRDRQISTQVIYWEGPEAGEVEVTVEHLRLIVDGGDFGTVQPGDLVVIDATASKAVKVNGKTRQRGVGAD